MVPSMNRARYSWLLLLLATSLSSLHARELIILNAGGAIYGRNAAGHLVLALESARN
jgi:hypothetical protein